MRLWDELRRRMSSGCRTSFAVAGDGSVGGGGRTSGGRRSATKAMNGYKSMYAVRLCQEWLIKLAGTRGWLKDAPVALVTIYGLRD